MICSKSEQVPTDQEQYMLMEDFYDVENYKNQEQNMTNKVNIEFIKTIRKLLTDVEN